ncbi:XisI protein [Okeania sp.]|uniref:XisI protein n=1 Tax=Okeania sp. TaxID=3100323 RepID=UPI002B4B0AD4|nr:XisI protein [Okeania sp.]MEB3340195.1 XisI protein [Okeania sp.]
METTNQLLDQEKWRETLINILQYYADLPYRYGDVKTYLIVSSDRNHFLLINEGWQQNGIRLYGTIVHAEICNDKIWIHHDGIEDGITDELVDAGVPKDKIVLAFHPPKIRQHTGYGV